MYSVAKLPADDLDQAIKDHIISPSMTRADLDAWILERRGRGTEGAEQKNQVIATLLVPSDYDTNKKAQLEQALEELRLEFGIDLKRPRDLEAEANNRVMREIDDYIRAGARQYLRKLKKTRLGKGRLTPAQRKWLWDYGEDEIEIPANASWDQVKYALNTVGSDDQFERLRDEALRLYGWSEKAMKEHPDVNHEEAMQELKEISSPTTSEATSDHDGKAQSG